MLADPTTLQQILGIWVEQLRAAFQHRGRRRHDPNRYRRRRRERILGGRLLLAVNLVVALPAGGSLADAAIYLDGQLLPLSSFSACTGSFSTAASGSLYLAAPPRTIRRPCSPACWAKR